MKSSGYKYASIPGLPSERLERKPVAERAIVMGSRILVVRRCVAARICPNEPFGKRVVSCRFATPRSRTKLLKTAKLLEDQWKRLT